MRSLVPSSSMRCRTRVGAPDFGSSSITFDAWIGAGISTMPLCSSARRARRWRFTMFTPSIVTRPSLGKTRRMRPSFPLSSPRTTRTRSPFVTCILTRCRFSSCRLWARTRARSVRLCLSMRTSDHLGGERHDLHVLLLAELARHRPEDARRPGLALLRDDHHRVLVEADVAAVLAPRLLDRAHDDRPRDVGLLHRAVGQRVLDRDDHLVAEARVAALRAAEHADDERPLGARVVRDPRSEEHTSELQSRQYLVCR